MVAVAFDYEWWFVKWENGGNFDSRVIVFFFVVIMDKEKWWFGVRLFG
jgi:hypothetical protein